MKVETIASEKKFEPITFNVTVESLGELCLLWGRLNPSKFKVMEFNKGCDKLNQHINGYDADTILFFRAVDVVVGELGLK